MKKLFIIAGSLLFLSAPLATSLGVGVAAALDPARNESGNQSNATNSTDPTDPNAAANATNNGSGATGGAAGGSGATGGSAATSSSKDDACAGVGGTVSNGVCATTDPRTIEGIVGTVISFLSYIAGAAAIIMIIVGGFRYITSGGESNATAAAKNTIVYASIGLVVALLAQVIVKYVFTKATS